MSILHNLRVKHKQFGNGSITTFGESAIEILFDFEKVSRKFDINSFFIKHSDGYVLDLVKDVENCSYLLQLFEANDFIKKYGSNTKISEDITNKSWFQECIDRYILLCHLRSYGFFGFLHTTSFSNFEKIYQSGHLLSRTNLISNKISFDDHAEKDIIDRTYDKIKCFNRFYFRPKTPTNISAYKTHGQTRQVIFVLKDEFIFSPQSVFFDGNAMALNSNATTNATCAKNSFNWDCIFSNVPIYDCDVTNTFLLNHHCSSLGELKRMRNAEFLCDDSIPLSWFKAIYFNSKEDCLRAINKFGHDNKFLYSNKMFYKETL